MKRGTAYFDFDDTLIHGDSILYWNRFLYQRCPHLKPFFVLQWLGVLLWLFRIIGSTGLKRLMLMPGAYLDPDRRDSLAREFGEKVLPFYAFPDIMQSLKEHQAEGRRVVILSASGDFYLKYIQAWTGADVVVGTTMLFPSQGWWRLPAYQRGNFKGAAKVKLLEASPDLFPTDEITWGYSDHHSDQYLLRWVQHARCVAPNKKLRRLAEGQSWKILTPFFPHKKLRSKRDRLERLYLMLFGWI